jgi:hypothetical protein
VTTQEAAAGVRARRGDLVVVHTRDTSYDRGSRVGPVTTHEWQIGVVTSVTREGLVKAVRYCYDTTPGSKGWTLARGGRVQGWQLVPRGRIDTAGALATAACHVYPGSEHSRGYASEGEVREALRPHLAGGPHAAELAAAAAVWLEAHRAAEADAREAHTEANRQQARAGYRTREGRELRNRLDREAMDARAAAITAANDAYRAAYAAARPDSVPE